MQSSDLNSYLIEDDYVLESTISINTFINNAPKIYAAINSGIALMTILTNSINSKKLSNMQISELKEYGYELNRLRVLLEDNPLGKATAIRNGNDPDNLSKIQNIFHKNGKSLLNEDRIKKLIEKIDATIKSIDDPKISLEYNDPRVFTNKEQLVQLFIMIGPEFIMFLNNILTLINKYKSKSN